MELTTRLDRNRYHWMTSDVENLAPASVLVEVITPPLPAPERTQPTALVVVLDRSGSMSGGRLEHAKKALADVIDRLSPNDYFGLVTFDDTVDVVVPAGPVTNRGAVKNAVAAVNAGGATDLTSGLLAGLAEAKRLDVATGVRVLVISDGHANHGVVDPDIVGPRVAQFVEHRVTVSCLGVGLGYDETLLDAIARAGTGDMHFAEEADSAAGAIAAECGELAGHRYLQCRLVVAPGNGVASVALVNDLPRKTLADGSIAIELGNLAADQARSLVLQFGAKQAPKPGRRKIAGLRLEWVSADDLGDRVAAQTVWAKIAAPADKPGQVDREVTAELLFQRVQRLKAKAAAGLAVGDFAAVMRRYERLVETIDKHLPDVPRDRRGEFEDLVVEVLQAMRDLRFDAAGTASLNSKALMASSAIASRKRNRRRPQ